LAFWKRNWYLNFGPYGFLIGAKETTFGANIKDDFNTIDFGLSLGVGVKIPVSTKLKISIEYEEQAGFTDILVKVLDLVLLTVAQA
jgi:opacity protein-like surface antigen